MRMETVAGDKAGSRADQAGRERKFIAIVGDLARVRGKQIGRQYAECFELIRLIL